MMSAGDSSAASAMGANAGMGVAWSVGSSLTGTLFQAFLNGPLQLEIMEVGYKSQLDHMTFVSNDAKVDRDMKLDTLATESEKQKIVQDGAERNNKAVERRKKCEDEVIVQKAIQHEHKVTKKFAEQKVSAAAIKKLFADPRTVHFYGNPKR